MSLPATISPLPSLLFSLLAPLTAFSASLPTTYKQQQQQQKCATATNSSQLQRMNCCWLLLRCALLQVTERVFYVAEAEIKINHSEICLFIFIYIYIFFLLRRVHIFGVQRFLNAYIPIVTVCKQCWSIALALHSHRYKCTCAFAVAYF